MNEGIVVFRDFVVNFFGDNVLTLGSAIIFIGLILCGLAFMTIRPFKEWAKLHIASLLLGAGILASAAAIARGIGATFGIGTF